jgi:lipopolysaccharide transport system ATP-binding protein
MVGRAQKNYFREFWALRDISFEVKKGETVGIIGRNGSGKSTLLQIICGTLSPSDGHVIRNGRIAALLELGSGFNPEFTGRDNVYMNAAVMGLSRREISARFDDIADFAGIGSFMDQPVKVYSSGMLVRLAFSVSVNINPDILIVDEALAVGDGAFQLKCMDRLRDLQERGASVFFVSHDLGSVARLCNRVHILDGGVKLPEESVFDSIRTYERILKIKSLGDTDGGGEVGPLITRHPLKRVYSESEYFPGSIGDQRAIITEVDIFARGNKDLTFNSGDRVSVIVIVFSQVEIPSVILGFGLRSVQGLRVLGGNTRFSEVKMGLNVGENKIEIEFDINVVAGEYFLNIGLVSDDGEMSDLDQRWGVRKINVRSFLAQLGVAYSPVSFRKL